MLYEGNLLVCAQVPSEANSIMGGTELPPVL